MESLKEKLVSRKFWTAVLGSLLLLGARALELDITPDQLYAAAGVLMSYVLGQGLVDARQAKDAKAPQGGASQ